MRDNHFKISGKALKNYRQTGVAESYLMNEIAQSLESTEDVVRPTSN